MAEQTLLFGTERNLVATLTLPEGGARAPLAVVLTNSGVIPRVGPHRMNVHLARRLAAMGIPSIRFDMSGLGDSRRASGTRPIAQQWVIDTREAMDLAQRHFGCSRFAMIGFCSGADVAHLTALEDERLQACVLWDGYVYPTLQARLRGLVHRLRRAGPVGLLQRVWARLRPKPKAEAADEGEPLEPGDEGPMIFGRTRVPPRDEYARRIQALVSRGVQLLFLYSGGEPLWLNYRGQFRDMFGRYGFVDRVDYQLLDEADHLLTRPQSQQRFIEVVMGWLQQRVLRR